MEEVQSLKKMEDQSEDQMPEVIIQKEDIEEEKMYKKIMDWEIHQAA